MAPYTSMNVDFAYENYYAEGSYFAVNVFMKEIEDYHGAESYTGPFNNVPDVFMSRLAQTSFLAGQCPGQGWVPDQLMLVGKQFL